MSADWTVAAFRDSVEEALAGDRSGHRLSMYFYAFTEAGWDEIGNAIVGWMKRRKKRQVMLFAGTDHAITGADAIRRAQQDGIDVRIPLRYRGVFHPKVMWLAAPASHSVWVGSNNLTRDGLGNNVEFAVLLKSRGVPRELRRWAAEIEDASAPATEELLRSYENQRASFEHARAKAKATTFTWRERAEPGTPSSVPTAEKGDLVFEVMPKETGSDGRQVQLPISAARGFFGIGKRKSKSIRLRRFPDGQPRNLKMTVFKNNTVRLTVRDLEYRDRPCVMLFRRETPVLFSYDIVPESIFPSNYKALLSRCAERTRTGSRRWAILP